MDNRFPLEPHRRIRELRRRCFKNVSTNTLPAPPPSRILRRDYTPNIPSPLRQVWNQDESETPDFSSSDCSSWEYSSMDSPEYRSIAELSADSDSETDSWHTAQSHQAPGPPLTSALSAGSYSNADSWHTVQSHQSHQRPGALPHSPRPTHPGFYSLSPGLITQNSPPSPEFTQAHRGRGQIPGEFNRYSDALFRTMDETATSTSQTDREVALRRNVRRLPRVADPGHRGLPTFVPSLSNTGNPTHREPTHEVPQPQPQVNGPSYEPSSFYPDQNGSHQGAAEHGQFTSQDGPGGQFDKPPSFNGGSNLPLVLNRPSDVPYYPGTLHDGAPGETNGHQGAAEYGPEYGQFTTQDGPGGQSDKPPSFNGGSNLPSVPNNQLNAPFHAGTLHDGAPGETNGHQDTAPQQRSQTGGKKVDVYLSLDVVRRLNGSYEYHGVAGFIRVNGLNVMNGLNGVNNAVPRLLTPAQPSSANFQHHNGSLPHGNHAMQ